RGIGFFQRRLETRHRLTEELAADVVVAHGGAHRVAADGHAFDQLVRVVAQDVAIVAGAGFGFVRIAHGIFLSRRIARHEAPFHTGRETRATTAAQARGLHRLDDGLARRLLGEDLLPRLVATGLAVVVDLPRLRELQRLEAHQVQLVVPLAHGHFRLSRTSSTFSVVRYS